MVTAKKSFKTLTTARQSPAQKLNPSATQPHHSPRLPLGSQVSPTSSRDPVFIPIPDLLSGVKPGQRMLRRQGYADDPVDSIRSAGRKFMG
jgi:hypothetical protein